jgi:predicted dinucleotide-binding enzyme
MKVGVLGSGDVAKALASGFIKHGHQVTLGTRDAGKLKELLAQHKGAQAASFADAAKFGELVVLAVKGTVALDALKAAGAANLAGKPVIDATNPIADAPPENGVLKFYTDLDQSLMERLQKAFPDAHFVKAYNSVGNARMINPDYPGGVKPTMFICGNDDKAAWCAASTISSAGRRPTWARRKRRARSNRCACCGASRASPRTSGPTRSSCCTRRERWPARAASRSPLSPAAIAASASRCAGSSPRAGRASC